MSLSLAPGIIVAPTLSTNVPFVTSTSSVVSLPLPSDQAQYTMTATVVKVDASSVSTLHVGCQSCSEIRPFTMTVGPSNAGYLPYKLDMNLATTFSNGFVEPFPQTARVNCASTTISPPTAGATPQPIPTDCTLFSGGQLDLTPSMTGQKIDDPLAFVAVTLLAVPVPSSTSTGSVSTTLSTTTGSTVKAAGSPLPTAGPSNTSTQSNANVAAGTSLPPTAPTSTRSNPAWKPSATAGAAALAGVLAFAGALW